MPKFAAEKKRKGQDMVYFVIIIIGCIIGLGVGLMSKQEPEKSYKPKKKTRSVWDDDPLYGTPLQKIK